MKREPLAKSQRLWHHAGMPKSKAKPAKATTKKPKKNPTDPLTLALSVVEAAIGEPLTPKRKRKKPATASKSRR